MGLFSWLVFGNKKPRPRDFSPQIEGFGVDAPEQDYWRLLDRIQDSERKKSYTEMLVYCRKTIPLLKDLAQDTIQQYGDFDLRVPAIELGCRYWSALEDMDALTALKEAVDSHPALKRHWAAEVRLAFAKAAHAASVWDHVRANPGVVQTGLKSVLGISPQEIRDLLYYMERVGRLKREKAGASYKLYVLSAI